MSTVHSNNHDMPSESIVYESDDECNVESNDNYLPSAIDLPPVDLMYLNDLGEFFLPDKIRDGSRRDQLTRAIEIGNYIPKLIDLFHRCEDRENIDGLHQIYDIIRSMIYLNKSSLFDVLFSDEYILDIIGCLEYESHLTCKTKRCHRDFLKTNATFKEVIPIGNQELLGKIHQTYRVQYIQDAILPAPSLFEENHLSTMNNFLYFNKVEIVTLLYVSENDKYAFVRFLC
jgi:protein phosphatase 4 regulatory subunit 3